MTTSLAKEFGLFRAFFWPIRAYEVRKIVPMLFMCFLICFNHSVLRNMKDAVVITASGAEVIPFIKVWVLLPMAILLTYVFVKLSNRYSQERVFYLMTVGFLLFYGLFVFVLYPIRDQIHPHAFALNLKKQLPSGLYGFIEMFRHWSSTLFYVVAELWSSIIFSVLFWGFANEITRVEESRRFYGVLGIASNLAAVAAGSVGNSFSISDELNPNLPFGACAWEQTTMMLTALVIFSGILIMILFRWMNKNVLTDSSFDELHFTRGEIKKKKQKLSVRESFSVLSNSKYLICIAIILVGYNFVINLVEITWKDQLTLLYPEPRDYHHYTNTLTSLMGIIATISAFFMAIMLSRLGWTKVAMITPAIMLITCVGFFGFYFFQDSLAGFVSTFLGTTPLAIVVFFGGAQNCLSKAAKYSVFDTTKEMAFIPLDHDVKLKGKAAIDGVGSRFGKSGGSVIYQALIMFFGTVAQCAPYIAAILMIAIGGWIVAVKSLGTQFNALAALKEKERKDKQRQPESAS